MPSQREDPRKAKQIPEEKNKSQAKIRKNNLPVGSSDSSSSRQRQ
jgi:hypothetical protein